MHREILKRCGTALVVIGAMDVGYMIWCIANQVNYNSSFNIFAIIAGILLINGNLKVSRWVARFIAFFLAMSLTIIVLIPALQPIGYFWAALKNSGLQGGLWVAVGALFLALLWWMRGQLYRPEVISAQIESGLKAPKPWLPLTLGAVAAMGLVVFLRFLTTGDTAKEAIRRADEKLGANYHYVVTNMQIGISMGHKSVSAVVAAYNDSEFKTIPIQWQE